MAKADDPFLAWLGELAGPLSAHQSRLLLGALIDCLRHSAAARREWHKAFDAWWKPRLLSPRVNGHDFDAIMHRVRQRPTPGRRPRSDHLRARYTAIFHLAELLPARAPTLPQFRQHLESWHRVGLLLKGPSRLPLVRLHGLSGRPERLTLALLTADTGKSVKAIQRRIRGSKLKALPAR